MGKLSFELPPFAPDYSGVCETLFSLGGLVVIHDASGCTGNYVKYDEPRWYGSHSRIYCSGLRELDVVLGNDKKLIKNIEEAAAASRPEFIAIVGSPVPTVTGIDLKGIAAQIEEETGIPSFGFPATGMGLYTAGARFCARELIRRFSLPYAFLRSSGEEKVHVHARESAPGLPGPGPKGKDNAYVCKSIGDPADLITQRRDTVNIIGNIPLDFGGDKTVSRLEAILKEHGAGIQASLWDKASMSMLRNVCRAGVNIAVTASGLFAAKYIYEVTGIPWIAGFPIAEEDNEDWINSVHETALSGRCLVWSRSGSRSIKAERSGKAMRSGQPIRTGRKKVLIIGDPVIGNSIRYYLEGVQQTQVPSGRAPEAHADMEHMPEEIPDERNALPDYGISISLLTPFDAPEEIILTNDFKARTEREIYERINAEDIDLVIADPLYRRLLDAGSKKEFVDLPHYALSSRLAPELCANTGEDMIRTACISAGNWLGRL